MAAGSRVGYEYEYRFSVDDGIVQRYEYDVVPENKTYLFEIRTVFTMNDHQTIISSETYDGELYDDGDERLKEIIIVGFNQMVSYRLADYWMPKDQMDRFDHDAIDFARNAAADPRRASEIVVPVAADIEVRTVQLDGEPIEEATNRAIRAEDLIPIYLSPFTSLVEEVECDHDRGSDLMFRLRRTRVESAAEGRALMRVCSVCQRSPNVGTQITVLPSCGHAFHSRCLVLWLMDHDVCPSCRNPARVRDNPLFDF